MLCKLYEEHKLVLVLFSKAKNSLFFKNYKNLYHMIHFII